MRYFKNTKVDVKLSKLLNTFKPQMLLNPEQPIEEIKAKDLLALTDDNRQYFVDRAFNYWRKKGFPYRSMSTEEIQHNFGKIKNSQTAATISGKRISGSTMGLDLTNSFHPQIW